MTVTVSGGGGESARESAGVAKPGLDCNIIAIWRVRDSDDSGFQPPVATGSIPLYA